MTTVSGYYQLECEVRRLKKEKLDLGIELCQVYADKQVLRFELCVKKYILDDKSKRYN